MASRTELTLGDLARIALGTPELGPANIAVLHSLIDLLLKKLDCRDEKVSISGYESRCLRQLLECTTIPGYAFQEDKIEILTDKFDRINALEDRVKAVSTRLEKHFDEIRECNKQGLNGTYEFKNWERYCGSCEDMCLSCEPENVIACQLISNIDFMRKMLRRIAYPLVERLFNFEKQIEDLNSSFEKFMESSKDHYLKMALVERCIEEIEHLKKLVDEHHLQFLGAMEEVQDMFDAKLDKIHLPALKKYVRDRFDSIESSLNSLRNTKMCPEPAGVVMDGIKCLSCGNDKVAADKSILIKGIMPAAHVKRTEKLSKKFCGCQYPPMGEPIVKENFIEFTPRVVKKDTSSTACKSGPTEHFLSEGTNGFLYRMDPVEIAAREMEKKEIEVLKAYEKQL